MIHISDGMRDREIEKYAVLLAGRYLVDVHLCAHPSVWALPALVLHGFDRRPGRFFIKVTAGDRPEVVVELVDQRDAGRDVQLGDLRVADAVEVLDQRP